MTQLPDLIQQPVHGGRQSFGRVVRTRSDFTSDACYQISAKILILSRPDSSLGSWRNIELITHRRRRFGRLGWPMIAVEVWTLHALSSMYM